MAGVFFLTVVIAATLANNVQRPLPSIADEFGYLLMADTFLQGRLTNPPHPLWQHFESMHIIHEPTYSTRYQPGQAAALAAGRATFGDPLVGVWVSAGLAAAATTWALGAWLPLWLAGAGGLLGATLLALSAWGQSFWGGAVAALGGALVLGGALRCAKETNPAAAMAFGFGASLLAATRPYEGLVYCATVTVWLLASQWRAAPEVRGRFLTDFVLPAATLLTPTMAFLLYYNRAVTGDALTLPQMHYISQYEIVPPFLWQEMRDTMPYRHEHLRAFFEGWTVPQFLGQQSPAGFLDGVRNKISLMSGFLWGLALAIPVSLSVMRWREPETKLMAICLMTTSVAALGSTYFLPHYVAPMLASAIGLAGVGMQWITDRFGKKIGVATTGLILVAYAAQWCGRYQNERPPKGSWPEQRAKIADDLKQLGGRHLVIVRYGQGHSPHDEWVYNGAEIDQEPVIWAHDMGEERSRTLLAHYPDRRTWLLQVGATKATFDEVAR